MSEGPPAGLSTRAQSLYRQKERAATPYPAGAWIGDALPDAETMQRIAADVGFSETAFIAPATGTERTVRYFSPEAEVSFCGHATIASGVILGERDGDATIASRHRWGT